MLKPHKISAYKQLRFPTYPNITLYLIPWVLECLKKKKKRARVFMSVEPQGTGTPFNSLPYFFHLCV